MTELDSPAGLDQHGRVDFWIREIETLDRVLEKPAISLIKVIHDAVLQPEGTEGRTSFTVRTLIQDKQAERPESYRESLLIHAVAGSAIQRLTQERRRFRWLEEHEIAGKLEHLRKSIPERYTTNEALNSPDILGKVECLNDWLFGTMSPMTAAEVFWLLIRGGEGFAHGEVGFLALFALLWALNGRTSSDFDAGAALGRWRPTVAVTARAILPILKLNEILAHRAAVFRRIAKICSDLKANEEGRNQRERWLVAAALDRLAMSLNELAKLSIRSKDFHEASNAMTALATPIDAHTDTKPKALQARREMRDALIKLGKQNEEILQKAERSTGEMQLQIIELLGNPTPAQRKVLLRDWKLTDDFQRHRDEAMAARATCQSALGELQRAVSISKAIDPNDDLPHEQLMDSLEQLARINENVKAILRSAIDDNVEWCARSVAREIAYASAQNDTEFDAAELLSGVEIAEWAGKISRAQVADAIRHSLVVARRDGSWATGQPVFLEKRALGVWPATTDLMLLLASVVRPYERLHEADAQLRRYVRWLEARTKRVEDQRVGELWGWQAETREDGIDIWSTATSVKTLLEIREIFEDRLWEICEERFTVLRKLNPVHQLDPVDLGARHEHRLQRRLFTMADRTMHQWKDAEFAFVLHGPPGSSKSAIAEAIGHDTWQVWSETRMPPRPPRMIRITPADFTRRGQEGLDVEARFIFRLLSHVRGVTILFDEIDDLLRNRAVGTEPSFIRLVIPGMLNRLQDLRDAASAQEVCFLLATNYIDQIEPALTRPGRLDGAIAVPYPDPWSRESILERVAKEKGVSISDDVKDAIVAATGEWPWPLYQKLCKSVVRGGVPEEELSALGSQLQAPEYYYSNRDRWRVTSVPFVNELVHFAFGRSKDPAVCRERIGELLQQEPAAKEKALAHFEKEWRREKRP